MKTVLRRPHLFLFFSIGILLFLSGLFFIYERIKEPVSPDATKNYAVLEQKVVPPEIKHELGVSTSSATMRVPILLYHYVEVVKDKNDTIRKSLALTPTTLEKQIETLMDNEYTFITVSELSDIVDGKKEVVKKPVVLTFDDGYSDFYTDVLPLLRQYQIRVTAYIVPGFLDHLNYMTTKNVQEIVASGLVEIGAHTLHHTYLKGAKENLVRKEIEGSKRFLEESFDTPVVSFAYPYGAFDKQAMQLVHDIGFKTAVTTVQGIEVSDQNRYFIYRIRPGARTGNALIKFLEQTSFKTHK